MTEQQGAMDLDTINKMMSCVMMGREMSAAAWALFYNAAGYSPQSGRCYEAPHSPQALWACLALLDLFPHWRSTIGQMGVYGDSWAAIVRSWDELEVVLRAEAEASISQGHLPGVHAPATKALLDKVLIDAARPPQAAAA